MPFVDPQSYVRFSGDRYRKNNFFAVPQMVADIYCLEPGQAQAVHAHAGEAKLYYVIDGQGDFTIGADTRRLGPGGCACAPAEVDHGVANCGADRLVVLVVIAPDPNARATSS